MNLLTQIWQERHKILEGIKNTVIRDEFVEDVAKLRQEVCDDCDSKGDECTVLGTGPCCNECGCSLTFKTRALSAGCPLDKWKAVCTEDEEDELDNLKN